MLSLAEHRVGIALVNLMGALDPRNGAVITDAVAIDRIVTTYQKNSLNIDDPSYLDATTLWCLETSRYHFRVQIAQSVSVEGDRVDQFVLRALPVADLVDRLAAALPAAAAAASPAPSPPAD